MEMIKRQMRAAEAYIARGWKLFVVTASKHPFANCNDCFHDKCGGGARGCRCGRFCHGFYAATDELKRVYAMLLRGGTGTQLALRTGTASGVLALDAEGHDADHAGVIGLEVLDQWETWTAGKAGELRDTLRSYTQSGGVHLLYQADAGTAVSSRNRVLPNVDVKCEGGYIVVGPSEGRGWQNWDEWKSRLEQPDETLLSWLQTAAPVVKAQLDGSSGSGTGIVNQYRTADVIPAGKRYEFTRGLVYLLRRSGKDRATADAVARGYWERYEQPPAGMRVVDGVWHFPWTQVEYELDRAWARLEAEQMTDTQRRVMARYNS